MHRRSFLKQLAAIPALAILWPRLSGTAQAVVSSPRIVFSPRTTFRSFMADRRSLGKTEK